MVDYLSQLSTNPLGSEESSMYTQLEARQPFQPLFQSEKSTSAKRFSGYRFIGLLTLLLVGWLLLHWRLSPLSLPPIWQELLTLLEMAGVATVTWVWVALWWQHRSPEAPIVPAFDKAELYDLSPTEFEQYVARLFQRKGYRVHQRGRRGDMGVDLEITQRRGKRAIVQCKRYRKTVGPDVVRELYGTLIHERVAHAFLVTTADISTAARDWASGKPMTLIDGDTLVQIATALALDEPS